MRAVIAGRLRNLAGWNPSRPDPRDKLFAAPIVSHLPSSGGPKQWRPRIEDQWWLGSCTANAGTSAFELLRKQYGLPEVQFSRLGLYWTTRVKIEGKDPHEDSGASMRDLMKAMVRFGIGLEDHYIYDVSHYGEDPGPDYFVEAVKYKLLRYHECPTLPAIKSALVSGWPVVFGFSVPNQMLDAGFNGYLQFPSVEDGYSGGHAVMCDHYDDSIVIPGEEKPGALLVVNSWGEGFGLKDQPGCFWMPYRMVEAGIASDFYALRLVDA